MENHAWFNALPSRFWFIVLNEESLLFICHRIPHVMYPVLLSQSYLWLLRPVPAMQVRTSLNATLKKAPKLHTLKWGEWTWIPRHFLISSPSTVLTAPLLFPGLNLQLGGNSLNICHWFNVHKFEQTLGNSEGQGSMVCCHPWGPKELGTTGWLNNIYIYIYIYICSTYM